MINKVAKEALSELAEDLYQIGEVEMTRDVFRIIASIKDEPEQQKKYSTIKTAEEVEKATERLSKIFR
jgi:hypothetical protein